MGSLVITDWKCPGLILNSFLDPKMIWLLSQSGHLQDLHCNETTLHEKPRHVDRKVQIGGMVSQQHCHECWVSGWQDPLQGGRHVLNFKNAMLVLRIQSSSVQHCAVCEIQNSSGRTT